MSALPTDRPASSRTPADEKRRSLHAPIGRHLGRDAGLVLDAVAVPSPVQPGVLTTAVVGRRLDVLAQEHGTGRITQAQFMVGRMIQLVFERGSGARLGSGTWDRVAGGDRSVAHELAILLALDDASRIRQFTARLETAIGAAGVRFLRAILVEGHSFKSYAAVRGRSGELGVRSVAERFRWHLEDLTEAQHTATGPERSSIRGGAC